MGIFSLFESKKSSTTTNDTDVLNVNQQLAGESIGVSGDGNSIVQTDQGAVRAALEGMERTSAGGFDLSQALAQAFFEVAENNSGRVIDFASLALEGVAQSNVDALAAIDQASRSDDTVTTETLIKYGSVTVFALAAMYLLRR